MTTIHTAITGNITSTLSINPSDPNGDLWIVNGAQFATGSTTALDINPGGTNTTVAFQNGASIWNGGFGGIAVDVESNATLQIDAGSTIQSGKDYPSAAIHAINGVELDIVNHGDIEADFYAISVANNALNHIVNYGTISAGDTVYSARFNTSGGALIDNFGTMQTKDANGYVLDLSSAAETIHNHGTMLGKIGLDGGADVLVNDGLIFGGTAQQITIWDQGGGKTITNAGSIINAAGADGVAIFLSNDADRIANSGKIVGDVVMGGGADTFAMENGGTISGTIDLGSGADKARTGDHGAEFTGGYGDDMFIMSGTGRDTIDGGSEPGNLDNDTLDYSGRADSVSVRLDGSSFVAVKLGGIVEDHVANIESVYGGKGADSLIGDARDNLFAGGAGKDTIDGGAGRDTVSYAKETSDVSLKLNGSKAVTVKIGGVAQDSIKNIEYVTGGGGNDRLTGDSRGNVLHGGMGGDTLNGGTGHDSLFGDNGGADVYLFNTKIAAANSDTIYGFVSGLDRIQLDNAAMTALGTHTGAIGNQFYHAAGATHGADGNDHIVYNETDGHLYYDSNGSAAGGVTLIAVLAGAPALAATDISIV